MAIIGYVGAAGTSGAGGFHPLSVQEQAYWGASHVAIITWEDIPSGIATATAATLGITELLPIIGGVNAVLLQCDFFRLITPFANSALAAQNSTQVEIGDNENANRYLANTETNLNGAYINIGVATGSGSAHVYTATDILQCTFAAPAAGQTLSNLTQGEIRAYFRFRDNTLPA